MLNAEKKLGVTTRQRVLPLRLWKVSERGAEMKGYSDCGWVGHIAIGEKVGGICSCGEWVNDRGVIKEVSKTDLSAKA